MTQDESRQDIPKIAASVMVAVPSLVFRTGWAYLRMKKRARKSSKMLEKKLVSEGVPPEYAERLAEEYATEISIRKIMRRTDMIPFGGAWRQQ